MGLENIYTIAQSIQPFIKDGTTTPEGVYKIIMTNNHLRFIQEIFSIDLIPLLVFVSYEIAIGNDNPNIVGEIKNNLFYFNIFQFGDTENDIDCNRCGGDGTDNCGECDGNGQIRCDWCGGDGEDEEGNTCNDCDGERFLDCQSCNNGMVECNDCDGRGLVTYYDEIPYDINYCVSHDKELKVILDQSILRNEPINLNKREKNNSLILSVYTTNVGESSYTEEISKDYKNDDFAGIVLLPDEVTLRYSGSKIFIKELDIAPEKFIG